MKAILLPRRRCKGISLLEMLVAMALGALLLMLLNSVLSHVQTGWRRAEASAAALNDQLAGLTFLDTALASALPPDPLDQSTRFVGTADQIAFIATPPKADAFRGAVNMRFYLQQEDGGKSLMMDMHAMGKTVPLRSAATTVTVLSGLEAVTFSFSGQERDQLQQTAAWNDPEKLPKLIQISLSFTDKSLKPIRVAIAPRQTIAGRCSYDLISLHCRT